jgi:molecular chaperone DnaK
MADTIIGIDLGTTNSVMAVLEHGAPRIIPTAEGRNLCPSVVGFTPSGDRVVGDIAKRQLLTHPTRSTASIKRFMGTRHVVTIDDKSYTPPEISALILQKLHHDAEDFLGERIKKAVITVPAYFSDAQRQATRDAGRISGLDVVRIVNEPTAAALAYGMDKKGLQTILVWDLGGGTFDVSILQLTNGVFQVLSTNGDNKLGGDDWDGRMMMYQLHTLKEREGVDLSKDRLVLQRMKEAAEKAKVQLSTLESTFINLPFIATAGGKPCHLEMEVSRDKFEELTKDLRQRMIDPTAQALADAKMMPRDLDAVVLVGGSTRMPAVQQMVREILVHEPVKGVNPDEVVALGAAIQGGIISGALNNMLLLDVTPLSLGIETSGGMFTRVIPRNTTIPTSETKTFTTSKDGQTAVKIHVLQGEREIAAQNKALGRFTLDGVRLAKRGQPRIDVTFDIDQNGIVHVNAIDQETGSSQAVLVNVSSGLSEQEIQNLINEAEKFAKSDLKVVEIADLKTQAEQMLDKVNSELNRVMDDIPIVELAGFDHAIARLRYAAEGDSPQELRASIDSLRDLCHVLVEYGVKMADLGPAVTGSIASTVKSGQGKR